MTVTAPPRLPDLDDPVEPDEPEALEALIEEARQRQRRRRRRVGAGASVLLLGAALALGLVRTLHSETAAPALAAGAGALGGTTGSKIAFVNGTGDILAGHAPAGSGLYVVNPDGSELRLLTRMGSPVGVPVWSPDGQTIAFSGQGGGISVVSVDGSGLKRLAEDGWGVAWSPDGSKMAFDNDGIHVMNADGSGKRRLTEAGGVPVWSPDGRRIAFGSQTLDGDQFPIYVMRADGSEPEMVVDDGFFGSWSPDGRKIAFLRTGKGVFVANADGSGERALTPSSLDLGGDVRNVPFWPPNGGHFWVAPVWSPDGQAIAFGTPSHVLTPTMSLGDVPEGTTNIYVMNTDGSGLRKLVDRASGFHGLVWSPDSKQIGFVNDYEIQVVNADGSGLRTLTRRSPLGQDASPSWSPAPAR